MKPLHYHAVIRKALEYAVKTELLTSNPADKIDRPKKGTFHSNFYNKQEIQQLFEVMKDDHMELMVHIAAYYGLRRSEVIGLKWSAIDFDNKMMKINHKIVNINKKLIGQNKMKNKSSNRTLPLIPQIEKMLLLEKAKQTQNRKDFGSSYNKKYEEYVNVDPMGNLYTPDHVTERFRRILKKHNLKLIRFHDLRHSCASLMLAQNVQMKSIQEWLGHSTYQTTADVYSHLDFSSKISSAQSIANALNFNETLFCEDEIENEPTDEELDKQIAELEQMKARRQKSKDFEM